MESDCVGLDSISRMCSCRDFLVTLDGVFSMGNPSKQECTTRARTYVRFASDA